MDSSVTPVTLPVTLPLPLPLPLLLVSALPHMLLLASSG